MLGKMLKYDIKAMARTFIPFYIAILAMSILNNIFIHSEWLYGIIGGSGIIFMLFFALAITSTVLIITQFYKSVLGDQGYLTNTLPVSVDTIILSKMVSSILWIICSCIVGVASGIILLFGVVPELRIRDIFSAAGELFQVVFRYLETPNGPRNISLIICCLLLLLLIMLTVLINEILHFYCAMACSQLRPLAKNRIASSFIAYIVIGIPISVLSGILFGGAAFLSDQFGLTQAFSTDIVFALGLTAFFLIFTILDIALYLPTRYILKNKLNLE